VARTRGGVALGKASKRPLFEKSGAKLLLLRGMGATRATPMAQIIRRLFGSFSSEKELLIDKHQKTTGEQKP
jgi:hypothetical protein